MAALITQLGSFLYLIGVAVVLQHLYATYLFNHPEESWALKGRDWLRREYRHYQAHRQFRIWESALTSEEPLPEAPEA